MSTFAHLHFRGFIGSTTCRGLSLLRGLSTAFHGPSCTSPSAASFWSLFADLFEPDAWPHLPRKFAIKPILAAEDFASSKKDGAGEDDDSDACADKHDMCPGWAGRGECEANPAYMHTGCRLSCGLCRPPSSAQPVYRDVVFSTGEPNTIPQMDAGDAVLCELRPAIQRLQAQPTPLAEVIQRSARRPDAVFVMRNGRSEGVWVSWPSGKATEFPEDVLVDPWLGCMHHLYRTVSHLLLCGSPPLG